jgi:hypothetical protein
MSQKFHIWLQVARPQTEAVRAVSDAIAAAATLSKQQCLALNITRVATWPGAPHPVVGVETRSRSAAAALLTLWHPGASPDHINEELVIAQQNAMAHA